jgi:predicted transglutaminase-like cysteine proteinase
VTKTRNSFLAGLFTALVLIASAHAQPNQVWALSATSASQSASATDATPRGIGSKIRFGQLTAIPNGYYEMCVSHQSLCRIRGGRLAASSDGSVKLTSATMGQLASVNADVNAAIRPAYRDGWMPERTVGDCKDFALTKRQRLIESGWPSSALPLAIVRTFSGEKHLVLVARTNEGDFVLDNLAQWVVPWTRTSYSWEKIQSTTNIWAWHTIT